MYGLVYHGNKNVRLENVPEPEPDRNEVKIKIDFCGICATDIEEYEFGPKFISFDTPHPLTQSKVPLIIGHEITGTIVSLGANVTNVKIGTKIVLDGTISCMKCNQCTSGKTTQCHSLGTVGFSQNGGLAEYLTWPAAKIIEIPPEVSSKEAALTEPTSVAHHAIQQGEISSNETIVILGVGTIGLLSLQIAKSIGSKVVAIDQNKMKLEMAKKLGADEIIDSSKENVSESLQKLTVSGPDVVIDTAGGIETSIKATEWVRSGGRVVLVAIYTSTPKYDFNTIVAKEIQVLGSLGYNINDVKAAINLIAQKKVLTKPLISEIIGIDKVLSYGYPKMLAESKDIFRILVDPSKY